jgi:hypothetical protein
MQCPTITFKCGTGQPGSRAAYSERVLGLGVCRRVMREANLLINRNFCMLPHNHNI